MHAIIWMGKRKISRTEKDWRTYILSRWDIITHQDNMYIDSQFWRSTLILSIDHKLRFSS